MTIRRSGTRPEVPAAARSPKAPVAPALVADGDDPEDKDNHQFFVPKRARWSEVQRAATNLGETLNKACAALEGANGSLEGVLAGIDFNDERKHRGCSQPGRGPRQARAALLEGHSAQRQPR